MKNLMLSFPLIYLLFFSCNVQTEKATVEDWKQEILDTENRFAEMAIDEGIRRAFLTYAAEEAVLMRNDSLVIGKENIREFFSKMSSDDRNEKLTWKPDFIDVAVSGDLGYTYGRYTYSFTDTNGARNEYTGIFHTVWKRQDDGTWRFVWD